MTAPDPRRPAPEAEPVTAAATTDVDSAQESAPEPAPEPWTPARSLEWNAYYDIYVALGALLLVFVVSANKIAHSALWTQLQVGREIARTGAPVATDLFSYTTAEGSRWVDIPWLFEWSHAAVHKFAYGLVPADANDPGASRARADQVAAGTLVAINALVRLFTALTLLGVRRLGPGRWWSAVCVVLALGAVATPDLVILGGIAFPGRVEPANWGLLLLALELWLLHRAVNLGRRTAVYALAPLFALWANVDESFLIGLAILGATALGRLRPAPDEGPTGMTLPVGFAALGASALACLINPSTFHVYGAAADPFMVLFRKSSEALTTDQLSFFGPGLKRTAEDGYAALLAYYLISVGLGAGSFLLNRRRFSLSRFLVYLLVAVLWGTFFRYRTEFAAVFAVTMALNGQEWYLDRFGAEGRLGWRWSLWSVGGRAVTIVLVFVCVAKALTGWGVNWADTRFGFGYDPDEFAFEAADYLKAAPIAGNVLNTTVTQGDALVWRAWPERKTFIDGRQHLFPAGLVAALQKLRTALKEDDVDAWKPELDRYKVSAVMIQPETAPNTVRVLGQSPNWVPFYDDGAVIIYGRTDAAAADLAFFKKNRLDPNRVFTVTSPTPPSGPPTPVTAMDNVFPARTTTRPQPHTESARRWLNGAEVAPGMTALPEPARCLAAVHEARTALASKPDDTQAFRVLASAYNALMVQETALLAGLKITPENAAQISRLVPRTDVLATRFRQRMTSLNYAVLTTPTPKTPAARNELQGLNFQIFQLDLAANHVDLARDRLQAVLDKSQPGDFTPEERAQFSQELAQLNERTDLVRDRLKELSAEQQAGPDQLAAVALSQGTPGLAIQELEQADRTGFKPNVVKPQLLDLYCETGQPEKAVEMLNTGTIEDPTFGAEPGTSALRQGRAYFLLGNDEYAATLWEKYAIPRLRYTRAAQSLGASQGMVKGEPRTAVAAFLSVPDNVKTQAVWEFDAALCRLEGGLPDLAAEHFTKSLTLNPRISYRPIIAYYLEKLGKPVPPLPTSDKVDPQPEPKPTPAATPS